MLHHHFSKLLISSHVFRGLGPDSNTDPWPAEFKDLAYVAINSAKSVLELTANDADIASAFAGIPHYYHTMIAFACSFLLKISKRYQSHVSIDATLVLDTIKPVIKLCLNTKCTGHHLVHWIGRGLQVLLANYMKFTKEGDQQTQMHSRNDSGSTASYPLHMSDIPISMDGTEMQLDFNSSIWETASAMVYNDGIPMSLQGYSNPPAQVVDSMPDHEASSQHDSNTLSECSWDPFASYPTIEHLGLGLL
jgi:hypothetical protein